MIQPVLDHLRQSAPTALNQLCDLLRIPGVSTRPEHAEDVQRSADWTAAYLRQAGLKVQIWTTPRHPCVYAEWLGAGPDKPTVLIYGHHDVQPADAHQPWTSPPFEPVLRDNRIYARGSADDKGQVFCHMRAVAAWLAVAGRCPVNVKLLIEGEEEIGSPNLLALLREKRPQLDCNLVCLSDSSLYAPGQPALALGNRGLLGMEVRLTGPNRDLHSGIFGGTVPNPIAALAHLLADLHDQQGRVNVRGFYDHVRPIPEQERQSWASLPMDEAAYARDLGCGLFGETGYTLNERRWARPTLEFNGITGGYQGPGSNTIVPSWASVKITCRLVPDQQPEQIAEQVAQAIQQRCPPGVKVEVSVGKGNCPAYVCPADHPALSAAEKAFEAEWGAKPVKIREGGTLPILPGFKQVLGADSVMLGFSHPDCRAHSFDEFFEIDSLERGSAVAARFLGHLAG